MQQAELSRASEAHVHGRFVLEVRQECTGADAFYISESPEEKLDIEDDLINARRALRTASWAAIFYLITTDILGPFNAPFAFSQVGYVPGAVLYVVSE